MAERAFDYTTAVPGDAWPALSTPPVSRLTLALYCGASGDHNPLHVDQDFARDAGLGDVIAHGMLVMGYMSHAITVEGEVTERFIGGDGALCLRLALTARDQHGEAKTAGEAVIALP